MLVAVTKLGLKTTRGKVLTPQSFIGLLKKPVYAGWIVVDGWGGPVRGDFEPIVGHQTYESVLAVLAGKRPTVTPYDRSNPMFPLRQFVRCGGCGRPLTGSLSTGRGNKRYAYYHCHAKGCKAVTVKKGELEAKFREHLQRLQPKPEYLRLFREVVLDSWRSKQHDALATVGALEHQIDCLRSNLETLNAAFIYEKKISRDTYEQEKDKLDERLMLAEVNLREVQEEQLDVEAALEFAEHVISNVARLWVEFSFEQKQRLQRVLFPGGVTFLNGDFGNAATSCCFNLFPMENGEESRLATLRGFEPRYSP